MTNEYDNFNSRKAEYTTKYLPTCAVATEIADSQSVGGGSGTGGIAVAAELADRQKDVVAACLRARTRVVVDVERTLVSIASLISQTTAPAKGKRFGID